MVAISGCSKNALVSGFRLSNLPSFEQDSKVQFVIDGVYAFAYALDALKKDVCPTWRGICPAMTHYDGGEFYKNYLLKVDFTGKKIYISPLFFYQIHS